MIAYPVHTEAARAMLISAVSAKELPFTVDIVRGRRRSQEQNRLAFRWYGEIADQLDDRTRDEVRAECKLEIGVPIMREVESFRTRYDSIIRPLSYEHKLALMTEPLDLPVTRIMTTEQLGRYLDEMARRWSQRGVILTTPEPR
tara:strand:+ start:3916 stop:4347 length:432 start_codon:yes stop_codon:yes gene_type:complete